MNEEYRIALSEVYTVLLHIKQEFFDNIPFEVIYKITVNKSEDYNFEIDEKDKELEETIENKLGKRAKQILYLLYLRYWCEEENKKIKKELNNIEKSMKAKGVYDVFTVDLKKTYIENNREEENSMIIYEEEKFLKKIKNILIKLFKKVKKT
ncbi:MAG: hypothetical protein HFJ43_03220 [Clostridia bacterium]|nr:hypothetical protein [Clostridia bacterium]